MFKVQTASNLNYTSFLISSLLLTFASANTFNNEYRALLRIKNNLADEVKNRTKELEHAKEEIEKKEKQKSNYFINIAHETRTPLTLISNYIDMYIKKNNTSEEIQIIKHNIDKLKNDMINFLDIEKLERGQLFYDHDQIIDVSEILNEKILLFKEIAEKKQIKIKSDIEKRLFIKIDPFAFDKVINNFIDNAIKYSECNREIIITLKSENNKIIFIIEDQGYGISEEQITNIFKPYHQISNEKQNIQGIGLGLSIVDKIIKEINGKIEVESRLNVGTKFSILFNKYRLADNIINNKKIELSRPNENIHIKSINDSIFNSEYKSILIVEDNLDMQNFLYENLSDMYNVFISKNGLEAIEKLNKIPKPDMIISDIMMDGMDGLQFYDKLKSIQDYNDIPFIFLTARSSGLEKLEGLKRGAIDYIIKPFQFDELKNKIESLLNLIDNQNRKRINDINKKLSSFLHEQVKSDKERINFNIICADYNINLGEKEIIKLLLIGNEYKEISQKLETSIGSIRKRIHNIYKKLNVKNKIELIRMFDS